MPAGTRSSNITLRIVATSCPISWFQNGLRFQEDRQKTGCRMQADCQVQLTRDEQ
jgi:hypothetical protein